MASVMSRWKKNLKDNFFTVLLGSVAISFLVGYFIAQQQETKKREQWAEIFSGTPRIG
jgi:general stress protein CsbA